VEHFTDLPWEKITDFLVDMGSVAHTADFLSRFFDTIGRLIEHDHISCWFDVGEKQAASRKPNPCGMIPELTCVAASHVQEKAIVEFNSYYRALCPPPLKPVRPVMRLDWKYWSHTEYYNDYLGPLGIRYSLVPFDTKCATCTIHRGKSGPAFTEKDVTLLHVLAKHMFNLYSYLKKIEDLISVGRPLPEGNFNGLTDRQAEIARLMYLRLPAAEIAILLRISRRTVEKHILDMYERMNVWNRQSLLRRLYGKSV